MEKQKQIKYNIPGNPDPYEHITCVLMKRHIMMELISIFKIDYCYPNKRVTQYQLPPSSGVYYEERMKNTRPWTARNGKKYIANFFTYDEAFDAVQQSQATN